MRRAIIIGAGPAGSTAAVLLARGGWDVTLIEQHRFPRDKVCGECLSALGMEVLSRHGLACFHPIRLDRAAIVAQNGTEATVDLPHPMWGVTRVQMDGVLLDEARRAGARIVQPARVEKVGPGLVQARDLVTNDLLELRADQVLVADGKAALGRTRPAPTGDLGVKAHFVGVDDRRDTITLFGVAGHYVGLAPVEGDRWNAAMSVPAARVNAFGGDFDALFAQMRRENPALARRFTRATRTGEWLASPLPRFGVARRWPAGVTPLGNAAAALEPIGGEGMGLAIRSAELAAEALIHGHNPDDLRRAYKRLWRTRRPACRAAARAIASPALAAATVRVATRTPATIAVALKLIGK